MERFKKGYWSPPTQPVLEILLVSNSPPDAKKLDLCACKNKAGASDRRLHEHLCFRVCGDITRAKERMDWRVPIVSVKSSSNRTVKGTHTVRVRYDNQQLRCDGVLVDTLRPWQSVWPPFGRCNSTSRACFRLPHRVSALLLTTSLTLLLSQTLLHRLLLVSHPVRCACAISTISLPKWPSCRESAIVSQTSCCRSAKRGRARRLICERHWSAFGLSLAALCVDFRLVSGRAESRMDVAIN